MKVPALLLLLSVVVCLVLLPVNSAPITDLPGYNGPALSMDSGYITVNQTTGKSLFYWLVRSQSSPANDPLVLWLQGGPGCSGLFGLLQENGPFVPNYQGGLTYNTLSWSRLANMLYIEAPCGVGFSYSNDTGDYTTDDSLTADSNYAFLQNFLVQFPEFQGRDLWITGESYGGVYIPTLTQLILSNSSSALYKQFVGFMAGNPLFNCDSLNSIAYDVEVKLLYWHGTVSYSHYVDWVDHGCGNNFNRYCQLLFQEIISSVGVIEQPTKKSFMNKKLGYGQFVSPASKLADKRQPSLNPDNIFFDFCTGNGTLSFDIETPQNCTVSVDDLTTIYLNRADVQKAIHATQPIPAKKWAPCSPVVNYKFTGTSMMPLYAGFPKLKPSIRILIYSGDLDVLTCPFPTAQICLAELKANPISKWQPWFVNGATVGYVEVYDQYTYVTVKGGGHEAPLFQPLSAFNMFSRFLTGNSL